MMMKILCWNNRGAGDRDKRIIVKETCRQWRVDILTLQETKLVSCGRKVQLDLWGRKDWDFVHKEAL